MAIGRCVTIKPTVSIPTSSLLHRSSNRMNFKIRSFMFQQSGLLSFPVSTFNHTSSSRIIPILKPHNPNTTCVSFQRRCTREKFTETKTHDGDLGLWKHCASKMLFFLGPIKDTVFAITKAIFAWVLLGFMSVLYGKRKPPEEVLFDQLIGLDDPVEKMKKILIHLRYAKANVDSQVVPRGVLLYGPDKTGKTTLAHALAHEAKFTFVPTSGIDVVKNGAKRMLIDIFIEAVFFSPSIVFIEGIESIREENDVKLLLHLMDFCEKNDELIVGVVATTKNVVELHPKLYTKNGFSHVFKVDKPDLESREKMIDALLIDVAEDDKEKVCKLIASDASGYVWRDLKLVCENANMLAKVQSKGGERALVTLDHLYEALEFVAEKCYARYRGRNERNERYEEIKN